MEIDALETNLVYYRNRGLGVGGWGRGAASEIPLLASDHFFPDMNATGRNRGLNALDGVMKLSAGKGDGWRRWDIYIN